MAQRKSAWPTALAVAAILALPIIAAAQTYPPSGSSSGQSTTTPQSSQYSANDQNSPQFHLDEAKKVLDSISSTSITGDAASQIEQIKTEFNNLYNNFKNGGGSSVSSSASSGGATASSSATGGGQVGTSGSSSTPSSNSTMSGSDWKSSFTKIESQLDRLNVPKSAYAPQSASGGTTGTSGGISETPSSSTANVPSDVRDKLEQFRMHLEQFYSLAQR